VKIKTNELTRAALDWAVNQIEECCDDPNAPLFSTDWAVGGPIIEGENISIEHIPGAGDAGLDVWVATRIEGSSVSEEQGPTPLIAAMRCYVGSKLGDEVEIPKTLQTAEEAQ
jgi:hypothetical protein